MTSNAEAITPMVAFMGLIINRHMLNRQRVLLALGTLEPFPQCRPKRRLVVSRLRGRAVRLGVP
jgi:hypothetical protein